MTTPLPTLCERVWAKVPECRPRDVSVELCGVGNGFEWATTYPTTYHDGRTVDRVYEGPMRHVTAIAIIESSCLRHVGKVRISLEPSPVVSFQPINYATDDPVWIDVTAPTLVEALLLACEAKGSR